MGATPIDISEEDGVRYLHFGSDWVQGAMRLRKPVDLELEYTRDMMFGLLLQDGWREGSPWPRKILQIGLGAGSLTKFCYWKLPQSHTTTVEIDEGVWSVALQLFKLPDNDRRLQVEIADGIDFIRQTGPQYDYIIIDGYDEDAKVGQLDSLPFYQACRARLNEGGILAANLFGRSRQYAQPVARLNKAFDGHVCALPQCPSGNVIALGYAGPALSLPLTELRQRATALKAATGLDLRATLSRLEKSKLPDDTLHVGQSLAV